MKLYVVWSKTFNSLIGVYDELELANKLALTQAGEVVETELNHIHPGHAETLRALCGLLVEPEHMIEYASAIQVELDLEHSN